MTPEEFTVLAARIFNLGQDYGILGESESYSDNKRADKKYETYKALVQGTIDKLTKE